MAGRVFVRNTFLDIAESIELPPSRCVRRARSDESLHARCNPETLGKRTEEQLEQLSQLLQETTSPKANLKASPVQVEQKQQLQDTAAEPELAELKRLQGALGAALAGTGVGAEKMMMMASRRLCSKLAEPGSSSSISTMAPNDSEDLVEFELTEDDKTWEAGYPADPFATAAAASWNYAALQTNRHDSRTSMAFETSKAWPVALRQQPQPVQHSQYQGLQKPGITINGRRVHQSSPKNVNLAEEFAKTEHTERPTTMMIRNIPNAYTQTQFIGELVELGFQDSYDFLYLPMDKNTAASIGYAFVNFVDADWAEKCKRELEGYRFKSQRKGCCKIATVSVAHLQGLEKNLAHYENTEVRAARRRQRRPVVVGNVAWRNSA